jgi:hypothetical protein
MMIWWSDSIGVKADLCPWSLRVSFYPVSSSSVVFAVRFPSADHGAVMVPVSALSWPVAEHSGGDGRSAAVAMGAEKITSGDLVVWCKVVVVAPRPS